ncbi:MAG: hypothetical protein KKA84_07005 [Bacteroidetes bacterium]|nr:hypothetical protein [Bacteroidota bacterium]
MTLENIRDLDDEIFEVMQINFHTAISTFSKVGLSNVGKAYTMFITKTNFIKNAIFDICENDDPYSANILFRSLIEHHLKYMFIFIRNTKEQNDNVGVEYYQYCDFSESIIIGKSWLDSWQILTPENEDKLYEVIIEKKPELKSFSKKEIIQKAKQFNYRNIVSFIKESIAEANSNYGWLDKIIPNYGDLSSYVHGGPLADKYLTYFGNENKRNKELLNICQLTFITANNLKQLLYLLLAELDKKQYSGSLRRIDFIIDEFNKTA